MWFEVGFLLSAGALSAGYLAVVASRWPSDEQPAQLKQQQMVERYPGATGDALERMMQLANPVTQRGRARPLGAAAAVMAVLAVIAFLLG